ncbi:MAG: right-handed parallel beta-helix repeat-containing protein [Anaerolineae bacterium]
MNEDKGITLYVATNGDDAWSGQLPAPNEALTDGPLASLAGARDAVRALRAELAANAPVTVLVRGGTYPLAEPWVLTPADSGTEDSPVTYAAFPGDAPVFSGGRRIQADWQPYRGEIVVCDVPEARDGGWAFRQLFVNGQRQDRARLPNDGYYRIVEPAGDNAFIYREGDIDATWHNLEDVEVLVYHSWNDSRLRVEAVDPDKRVVTFTGGPEPSHPFGWQGPNRYVVENVLEGLQRPGEWYLDSRAGKLYWWPTCDPAAAEVVAPVLTELVRFDGSAENDAWIEHVHLRGLTFLHADWTLPPSGYAGCGDVGDIVPPSAVDLSNVRHCSLVDSRIGHVGNYALEMEGYDNRIVGNEIWSTGSGGIITRNFYQEPNDVSYNHIHDCGAVYPSAVGINIDDGGGSFCHNLIHDVTQSGIYARHWATDYQPRERRNQEQALIIAHNEIHDLMYTINDGAGIFVRDANILIDNNLIHDCYSYGDHTPGWGIYLGCETRDMVVRNNVVYRTRESVHVWFSNRRNVLENNVFVDGLKTQVSYDNPSDRGHEEIVFRNNIVSYGGDASLFRVMGERSLPVRSEGNVLWQSDGKEIRIERLENVSTLDEWRELGLDAESVVADPCFADPGNDDYRVLPHSPAYALGFRPIDLSHVGLRGCYGS